MPRSEQVSLHRRLSAARLLPGRSIIGLNATVHLRCLEGGTSLSGLREQLRDRSVLLAARDQLAAFLALIELDGVARRIVLCPPGLLADHAAHVALIAEADAIVSDQEQPWNGAVSVGRHVHCAGRITPDHGGRGEDRLTEWVLLTSGTTGVPKLVAHTLATLTGAIRPAPGGAPVWTTFYDIHRYGGLQIALRAVLGGESLVLSSADEAVGDFLTRAGAHGVTHISGTPSHWRRALMSPQVRAISPDYVRLSGEIADQGILDQLRAAFPRAEIAHAPTSTEAGVTFEVGNGRAGFPAEQVEQRDASVELRIEGGSLRMRSARTALGYLDPLDRPLADVDGFADTGDMVELRGGRYQFAGRRSGINVGSAKAHPEEVEAVINQHPGVRMSLVTARRSPITGAIVTAEIVPAATDVAPDRLRDKVSTACRGALDAHKVPAVISLVPSLGMAASSKLARPSA